MRLGRTFGRQAGSGRHVLGFPRTWMTPEPALRNAARGDAMLSWALIFLVIAPIGWPARLRRHRGRALPGIAGILFYVFLVPADRVADHAHGQGPRAPRGAPRQRSGWQRAPWASHGAFLRLCLRRSGGAPCRSGATLLRNAEPVLGQCRLGPSIRSASASINTFSLRRGPALAQGQGRGPHRIGAPVGERQGKGERRMHVARQDQVAPPPRPSARAPAGPPITRPVSGPSGNPRPADGGRPRP